MVNNIESKIIKGFVVTCNAHHRIEQIIFKNINISKLKEGNLLTTIIDENNLNKAMQFIMEIKNNGAVLGKEINVVTDDEIKTLNFQGINYQKQFMILAFCHNEDIVDYYEDIIKTNTEYVNEIRRLLKKQLYNQSGENNDNTDIYENMTSLNNELTNLQRKLQKKNKELEIQQKKLEYYASTDRLTGILNRRAGLEIFNKYLEYSKRNNTNLTVAFIDINNLKEVNDNYGHESGDRLIKSVSSILISNIREADLACRLGGDEFLVVFPDCARRGAENIWNRINNEIKKINLSSKDSFTISISYGFAEYDHSPDTTIDDLINIADKRMYTMKKRLKGK